METLGDWLKPIIGMVILAGFLEMILPDNQLKGVTKMVLGLVIIMFLLRPLTRILNVPALLAGSLPRSAEADLTVSDTERVIREGERLRNGWLQANRSQAEKELGSQMEQIIGLFEGMELEGVACQYEGSGLKQVRIGVRAKTGLPTPSAAREQLERKLNRAVQIFTRLRQNQIEIRWGDQK